MVLTVTNTNCAFPLSQLMKAVNCIFHVNQMEKLNGFFLSRARLETVKLPLSVHLFEISSYNRILKLCTGPFMTVSSMGNIN